VTAGYSGTPLAKKLSLKDGMRVWREGMPDSVAHEIASEGLALDLLPWGITGTTWRDARNGPVRLVAIVRSQSSSDVSVTDPGARTPAQVNRTSTRPWVATTASVSSRTLASEVASTGWVVSRSPANSARSRATRSSAASDRSAIATLAPSPRNRRAVARPMAPAPPVMSATRPSRRPTVRC